MNFIISNIEGIGKIFLISLLFLMIILILYKLIIILLRSLYEFVRYLRFKNFKFQFKDFNHLSNIHFSIWCKNLLSKHGYTFVNDLSKTNFYSTFKVKNQDTNYIVLTTQHMYSLNDKYVSEDYINLLLGFMEEYKVYDGIFVTNGKMSIDLSNLPAQFNLLILDCDKLHSKFKFKDKCHLYFSNN